MTRTFFRIAVLVAVAAGGAAIPIACSEDDNVAGATSGVGANSVTGSAQGGSGQGGSTAQGGTTSTATATGGMGPVVEAPCQNHTYQCGDTVDNDMDGLIDSYDPDCLGPCDNTEDSYYGGIPGQNNAPCKADCYFDQDTGPGNDDCYWSHECDPNSVPPDYYPEPSNMCVCTPTSGTPGCEDVNIPGTSGSCASLYMAQSQECLDYCGPLTPNGCDCFGCCELPAGSNSFVYLGSTGVNEDTVCTDADVGNPAICHPCLPVQACFNDCDKCEICIGKPTLPPECFDPDGGGAGGGSNNPGQCPPGVQPCGQMGQDPCPSGFYCITGCCQELPN